MRLRGETAASVMFNVEVVRDNGYDEGFNSKVKLPLYGKKVGFKVCGECSMK